MGSRPSSPATQAGPCPRLGSEPAQGLPPYSISCTYTRKQHYILQTVCQCYCPIVSNIRYGRAARVVAHTSHCPVACVVALRLLLWLSIASNL